MQQRQLRLGDILDDYCPRERRVTNHAVVAMVGSDVKQTRCTTCDAEHEYKHGKVPRQRRKQETPTALNSSTLTAPTGRPKRVSHELPDPEPTVPPPSPEPPQPGFENSQPTGAVAPDPDDSEPPASEDEEFEGPVHRPLIRATLPRPEGQPPPTRPVPEFTIRQPGRPNRFRHRHLRGGHPFEGGRNSNMPGGPPRAGMPRQGGGRPPMMSRLGRQKAKGRRQK